MKTMTQEIADKFEELAKQSPYFHKFTWYHSFLQVVYRMKESNIKELHELDMPCWIHIGKIYTKDEFIFIEANLYIDEIPKDYIDTMLKYNFVMFK